MIRSQFRKLLAYLGSPQMARTLGEALLKLFGYRRNTQVQAFTQANRVLVIRLDEIGDVVMTTPLLRELRRMLPAAWITLVVKPALCDLMALCPYVNEVLTYDGSASGRFLQLRRHGRALQLARRNLWRRRFDLAIVPRWGVDYYHASFVAYFSGASRRIAYSENVSAEKKQLNDGFDRLFTAVLNDNAPRHEVERNLDVLRFLGSEIHNHQLELWLNEEDEAFAERFLACNALRPDRLLVAFAPGAGALKRAWPLKHFIDLGQWLRMEYHARILVVGAAAEKYLGDQLQRHLGDAVLNAAGGTTLRQAAALLKRCALYVGNDTGPMHLAAAMSVPVIEISCHPQDGLPSHPNSPHIFGPWAVSHRVLQPAAALTPCSDHCRATEAHCILGVTVDRAQAACNEMLCQEWDVAMQKPRIRDRIVNQSPTNLG